MPITWDPSLSVGVKILDDQHRQLISTLNQFYSLIGQASIDPSKVDSAFQQIDNYVSIHFQTEESFFQQYGYPDAAAHISEHQNFSQHVSQIKKDFATDYITLVFQLTDYLEDWFVHHLSTVDKKYTKFFNEHGLT